MNRVADVPLVDMTDAELASAMYAAYYAGGDDADVATVRNEILSRLKVREQVDKLFTLTDRSLARIDEFVSLHLLA